jgi:predicted benzoate:H+ symporter BenE
MFRKKPKKTKPVTSEDYEALGRQIEAMYEAVNPDRKAVYRTALIKGIFTGVGGVIGATIVVALLLWVLSLFSELPLIGDISESVQTTIEQE